MVKTVVELSNKIIKYVKMHHKTQAQLLEETKLLFGKPLTPIMPSQKSMELRFSCSGTTATFLSMLRFALNFHDILYGQWEQKTHFGTA